MHKTSPGNLFESTGDKATACSAGQYSGPELLSENGEHKQFTNVLSSQINLRTAIKEKSTVTAEYLPSALKKHADKESRRKTDSSEWKLAPSLFQRLCVKMGKSLIDLFASRVSQQFPTYVAWRRDPYSDKYIHAATSTFSITWKKEFHYTFPPFCLITEVLNKIEKDKTKKLILITPCWQTQSWYPQMLSMLIRKPVICPLSEKLITNPSGQTHPLVIHQILTLVAWIVSGDICLRKNFQSRQPILSPIQGDKSYLSGYESPWKKWSGCCDRRLAYWTDI